MRVERHAQGKFYTIQCPEGTRIERRSEEPAEGEAVSHEYLVVPSNGKEVRIPADPPELLPLLAESGKFGITLMGEPVPDMRLAGVSCPGCGESDVNWLQVEDGPETVHCDHCGADFTLPVPTTSPVPLSDVPGR
jgi:ribosomal protein S27E